MNEKQTRSPDPQAQGSVPVDAEGAAARPKPAPPQSLELVPAKLTDVGRARPHNEDYVDYYIPPDQQQLARKGTIYLVADGMGGHQAGEVASRGAVEIAIGQYYSDTTHDIPTSLVRAFRLANQQIHSQSQTDPSKSGMGTTLVAAVILGRKVYIANVGDSRAYLINKKGITQITEDHSWVEEQVRAGLLTPEQARRHPQRNLVTRALGSKPDVEVDLFEGEIKAGDTLVLCSDGLTGRVEDQEIATIVREHPPQESARQLVDLANERGGNDNISVLIVEAQEEKATVRAPVIPPPKAKPARRSPLVPILGGVAVLLVVGLAALLGWWIFLREKPTPTATPTPTTTPTTPAVAPTSTATPEMEISPTVEVTEALTGTVPTPSPGTAEATATLIVTQAASDTPTPQPTSSRPPASATPTPTPTQQTGYVHQAPQLEFPAANAAASGIVEFRWSFGGQLRPQDAFQLLMWEAGEGPEQAWGAAGVTTELSQKINLDDLLPGKGTQDFVWTVVVVRDNKWTKDKEISPRADPRPFHYSGAQSAPAPTEQPQPTQDPCAGFQCTQAKCCRPRPHQCCASVCPDFCH